MEEIALLGFVLRFIYATLGVLGIVGTFWLLNRLTGRQFDRAYVRMMNEPLAAAIYTGARAIGVFLFYGMILG